MILVRRIFRIIFSYPVTRIYKFSTSTNQRKTVKNRAKNDIPAKIRAPFDSPITANRLTLSRSQWSNFAKSCDASERWERGPVYVKIHRVAHVGRRDCFPIILYWINGAETIEDPGSRYSRGPRSRTLRRAETWKRGFLLGEKSGAWISTYFAGWAELQMGERGTHPQAETTAQLTCGNLPVIQCYR